MAGGLRRVGGYHGASRLQPGQATVAGALNGAHRAGAAARRVAGRGAGRTDAGVHAWGQVVTFDADADGFDPARLQRSVNTLLGPAIVVRSVEVATPDFDARRSALARRYRYTVLNRDVPDPFLAATTWHVADPLDLRRHAAGLRPADRRARLLLVLPAAPSGDPDATPGAAGRTTPAGRDLGDGLLRFEIEASSFCQQMVRSLVGTMVTMGAGRRRAGEMAGVLRARDRSLAGQIAPPHGLCLWSVAYPGFDSSAADGRLPAPNNVRLRGTLPSGDAHVLPQAVRHRRGPGTSSTPTGWCSAAWPPRWPACCGASTSRSSPPTSTPATTSSSSTRPRSSSPPARPSQEGRLPPLRLPRRPQVQRPTPTSWPTTPEEAVRRPRSRACSPRARSAARCSGSSRSTPAPPTRTPPSSRSPEPLAHAASRQQG